MNKKKMNDLAVVLEKVNYLYRTMRKSNEPLKKVELALLKKYITDLYDGLVELELPLMPTHEVLSEHKVEFVPQQELVKTPPKVEVQPPKVEVIPPKVEAPVAPPPPPPPPPKVEVLPPKEEMPQEKIQYSKPDTNEDEGIKTQVFSSKPSGGVPKPLVAVEEEETLVMNKSQPKTLADNLSSGDKNAFPISFQQRYAFVNQLFGGDENAYNSAIAELSDSKGYIEALTYINLNLRYDFKWRDDDSVVREFLDIIKRRFLQ